MVRGSNKEVQKLHGILPRDSFFINISIMEPLDVAESPAGTLLLLSQTGHTLKPPTCHPPSSLDFQMDGQTMCICKEAYIAYTNIWMECVGGKKSIPGTDKAKLIVMSGTNHLTAEDEVVQVLSLSGLPLETLVKVWDLTSGAFGSPDAQHSLNKPTGTDVGWEKFIVLLSVSHQSSGLDLKSYMRKFIKPPPRRPPIPKGPNLALYNDMQAVVKQLGQTAIKDENAPKNRPPIRHRRQHSAPVSTIIETEIIQKSASAMSLPLKESGSAADSNPTPNNLEGSAPMPRKPAKIATAPPVPRKPAKLATFPSVRRNSDANIGRPPLNTPQASGSDISDGFQEYSTIFVRPPPIPLSLRAGWNSKIQNNSSSEQDEVPSSLKRSSQASTHTHSGSGDELYLDESRTPASHNILDLSELSDSVPPLLSESLQPHIRDSISGSIQPSTDPENAPIPLTTLQSPLLAARQSKYWEPAAVSISPIPYDIPEIPPYDIGGESLSLVTADTRQIARNRLIALKDQSYPSKEVISRRKSVLGFKKTVEAEFSLSILADALERAVHEDNLPLVATFIEFGADANNRQNVAKTKFERHAALQIAATAGYSHIIDYLIEKGADSTAINNALIFATAACQLNLAMRLISVHGADVNTFAKLPAEPIYGVSKHEVYINALGLAANIKEEQERIRFVEFLIERQCDVNGIVWRQYKTTTNQQYGFGYSNLALFVSQCATTVDRLLKAGAHAHTVRQEASKEAVCQFRKSGFHCQSMAIVQPISCLWNIDFNNNSSRCLSVLMQLVQHGSDPTRCEVNGISELLEDEGCKKSPLARAIKSQDVDGVEKLLQLGVSPNSVITFLQFHSGKSTGYAMSRTALNYAAQCGSLPIIQSLLAHCAEVNKLSNIYTPLTCQSGESALAEAASSGNLEVVQTLLHAGANPNDGSLHKAALNAQVEIVQLFLNQGAKLEKKLDEVPWPTYEGTWEGKNPDVNKTRKPRGDVLCFAMFWPGSRQQTSEDEKVNYLGLISILLNAYETYCLPIHQTVLRAALDNNNILGMEALLNFSFTLEHPALNLACNAPIYYIMCSDPGTSKSAKTALALTPVQYALMMQCEDYLVDFLVAKGANGSRVIYSQRSSDANFLKGTKLTWKKS